MSDDASFHGLDSVVGQTFSPMSIQSVWTESVSTTECLTVAILLPSGVRPKDVLSVRVLDGGRELEISIMWPNELYNISVLHKKWLKLDIRDSFALRKYHPKFLGFESFLKPYRKRSEDRIESIGYVPLRIQFQQHIFSRDHLEWFDDAARVLYVDVKTPTNSYGLCKDDAKEAELVHPATQYLIKL